MSFLSIAIGRPELQTRQCNPAFPNISINGHIAENPGFHPVSSPSLSQEQSSTITATMSVTTIYKGPYQTIGADSSPGLLYLKAFLQTIDSLEIDHVAELPKLLHPDAIFAVNNNPGVRAADTLSMFQKRPAKVAKFGHDTHTSWDIAHGDGSRTVMFESTSFTVLREDEEGVETRVREFSVLELVRWDGGLRALELKTYMDPSPAIERAQEIMQQSET